jgi:hypothetical protein
MDVHKQETQVCLEDAEGAVVREQRIRTTRERLTALVGGRPRARILLEAATESEWVAQHLEGLGRVESSCPGSLQRAEILLGSRRRLEEGGGELLSRSRMAALTK